MAEFPVEVYSVATVRAIDRAAIERGGISGYTLMGRAASAALDAIESEFPDARNYQILCGGGDNAGDGYVLARLAAARGIGVRVVELVPAKRLKGDAARACADFATNGRGASPWSGELAASTDLVVDAILGSGLERPVTGMLAEVVAVTNDSQLPVVALDIPTGLHADTGAVLGIAVQADLTITFVGLKAGLLLGEGPGLVGALEFADLGIPDAMCDGAIPLMRCIDSPLIKRALPRRRRSAHKGNFGHVLVIGGGPGMPGAARLCAEAALRTGAGRVSIATHPAQLAAITAERPEVMVHGVQGADDLDALLAAADVVAFGPGLGQSPWACGLYDTVASAPQATVWDADALNLLAGSMESGAPPRNGQRVFTPHPGEAARLLRLYTKEVQRDRMAAVASLHERLAGVVVLKGARTLVQGGDGPPWVSLAGNPGMAAAGMGDALTGVIAALLAQGLPPELAAAVGVEVHARAGDLAALKGERGMTALDLIRELRCVVNP
jgi:NAD(P)H-hydrate epimerase